MYCIVISIYHFDTVSFTIIGMVKIYHYSILRYLVGNIKTRNLDFERYKATLIFFKLDMRL